MVFVAFMAFIAFVAFVEFVAPVEFVIWTYDCHPRTKFICQRTSAKFGSGSQ